MLILQVYLKSDKQPMIVRLLSIVTLVLLCCSCGNTEKSAQQKASDTIGIEKPADRTDSVAAMQSTYTYSAPGSSGIVLGENVFCYQDSSFTSGKKFGVKMLDVVTILSVSEKRETMAESGQDGACDDYGYYWYQVSNSSEESGWLYGKYLRQYSDDYFETNEPQNPLKDAFGKSFTINGSVWYLTGLFETSIGSSNEDGLTGCDSEFILAFSPDEGEAIFPVYADQEYFENADQMIYSDSYGQLAFVWSSEGGDANMKNMYTDTYDGQEVLVLESEHHYQEGGANSKLYIVKKAGRFEVINYAFERIDMNAE